MSGIDILTFLVWLVAAVTFILALKFLASPKTARTGNQLGAMGMALVIAWTLIADFIVPGHAGRLWIVALGGIIGGVAGVLSARRVPMTAMPQMVAIFNGAGGGAAAVVAVSEFLASASASGGQLLPVVPVVATLLGAVIGGVSLTGSIVAFGKLQGLISGRAVTYNGQQIVAALLLGALVIIGVVLAVVVNSIPLFLLFVAIALVTGVALVMPIGGADMPVVISLLNSYTGIAVAATGFVLGNYALLIAGTLVGASGAILTQLMCRAMNRSLFNVLFGAFGAVVAGGGTGASGEEQAAREIGAEDAAVLMAYAKKVIIVPGYGMAVAQAQAPVRELMDLLIARGVDVEFAIHPVAGRMPGHMNVLLAEANVPYDRLKEMDEINDEFAAADVALVIGANDVTNPAARTDSSSPIFGMPILNVDAAQNVIVLKRSMAAGFAGIDNPLYADPKTAMLFGDAKASVQSLVNGVKSA